MSILAIQTLSILNIKFKAVLKKEKAGEEGEKEEEEGIRLLDIPCVLNYAVVIHRKAVALQCATKALMWS